MGPPRPRREAVPCATSHARSEVLQDAEVGEYAPQGMRRVSTPITFFAGRAAPRPEPPGRGVCYLGVGCFIEGKER